MHFQPLTWQYSDLSEADYSNALPETTLARKNRQAGFQTEINAGRLPRSCNQNLGWPPSIPQNNSIQHSVKPPHHLCLRPQVVLHGPHIFLHWGKLRGPKTGHSYFYERPGWTPDPQHWIARQQCRVFSQATTSGNPVACTLAPARWHNKVPRQEAVQDI